MTDETDTLESQMIGVCNENRLSSLSFHVNLNADGSHHFSVFAHMKYGEEQECALKSGDDGLADLAAEAIAAVTLKCANIKVPELKAA